MKSTQELIKEDFLKRFQVYFPQTLFAPDFDMLLVDRCILCRNKLKFGKKRPIAFCRSKKHSKPFFINIPRLHQIQLAYGNSLPTE